MSNDQQPPDPAAAPRRGWGGEYDSEATAHIELPSPARPGDGGEDHDPLAAPGHGYQPPALDQPASAPATTEATTDPGATGQWTMPFAYGGTATSQPATGERAAMGQGAAAAASHWPPHPPEPVLDSPPGEHPLPGAPPPHEQPLGHEPVAPEEPAAEQARGSDHPELSYVLRVNGADRPVTGAWIGESLLYVLRERLGLAGAKDGCAQGECGACSVQVDGRLVAACLVPAATAAGGEIRTVEGLGEDGVPSDVQRALAAVPVQCGFCLPGMVMTVHDLLEGNHAPTERETREALSGNLCRCSGYNGVLAAVRTVAGERARAAEPAAEDEAVGGDPPHDDGATGGTTARIPHQAGPPAGGMS